MCQNGHEKSKIGLLVICFKTCRLLQQLKLADSPKNIPVYSIEHNSHKILGNAYHRICWNLVSKCLYIDKLGILRKYRKTCRSLHIWDTCSRTGTPCIICRWFSQKCSVSHHSTHSFIAHLGWGWFRSSIHELLARSCTKK